MVVPGATPKAQPAAAAPTTSVPQAPKDSQQIQNVSAALDVESSLPLTSVQLDGLVVLKIIKHCREAYPTDVTGQLLGLDVHGVLDVTNCFPFPSDDDDEANGMEHDFGSFFEMVAREEGFTLRFW
ncbi:hypothetical protein BC938DRAFT_474765 [Jimgerdemannia flammicorona]|uniref:MPN domain-containing protein n=1 Tax=Jimgerdemannia flammicorona TaxID=994334 RepID=A0A433Q1R0_9FUNG|nr:hypothetical protein BC938DRAFT_474765 [Jimgerdemannia flammicorona]